MRGPQWKHLLGGSAAVDGLHGAGTGTLTRTEPNPNWTVYLGEPFAIGEIVIREGGSELAGRSKRDTGDPINERPLVVEVSPDNQRWRRVFVAEEASDGEPLRIRFDGNVRGRFLRISAKDTRLALDEVEVYAKP